jgi:hypothetical protein
MTGVQYNHPSSFRDSPHLASAVEREAARVLARLIDHLHVATVTTTGARIDATSRPRSSIGSPRGAPAPRTWRTTSPASPTTATPLA